MGVRKAGRCTINVDGRDYVYWLPNDGASLRVASADKKFVVAYQLYHAADQQPVLRVSGPEFPGLPAGGPRPIYLVPPRFDLAHGPKTLARAIIRWSLRPDHQLNRVPRPAQSSF